VVVAEGTNGTFLARFAVDFLNGSANEIVTVEYRTVDGSARAGQDYVTTNGLLVFNPGETSKTIEVVVTADVPPELEEDFFVELTNPVNAFLGYSVGSCVITEVQIRTIQVNAVVRVGTLNAHSYVLDRSADGVTWEQVPGSEVLGNGDIMTLIDAGSGCLRFQYRARLLP
jgi:hypothetical protein